MDDYKTETCMGCNTNSNLTKRVFIWKIENLLKYISDDNYRQWYTTYETYLCSICNQKSININELEGIDEEDLQEKLQKLLDLKSTE